MTRRVLLSCGIGAPVLYGLMNIAGAMLYPGYNSVSQTISELGAIGAPSRTVVFPLTLAYDTLGAAFGVGIWRTAGRRRRLRVVGALMLASAAFDATLAPFAAMHQREVLAAGGGTLSDSLHLLLGAVDALFMFLLMGVAAAALGRHLRLYSIASMLALVGFGALMARDSPRLQANLPTPWIGLTERAMVLTYLLWMVVLAVALLRARESAPKPALRPGVVEPRRRRQPRQLAHA